MQGYQSGSPRPSPTAAASSSASTDAASTGSIVGCGLRPWLVTGRWKCSARPENTLIRTARGVQRLRQPLPEDLFRPRELLQRRAGSTRFPSNLNLILGPADPGHRVRWDRLHLGRCPLHLRCAGHGDHRIRVLFGAGGGSSALAGLLPAICRSPFIETLVPGPGRSYTGDPVVRDTRSRPEQILAMKRDKSLPWRRSPVLLAPADYPAFVSRDHRVLLLLQLSARAHPQRARPRPARGRGGPQNPDCGGFAVTQSAIARFLADEPLRVLRRDRADTADAGAMRSCVNRGQQPLRSCPATSIQVHSGMLVCLALRR